MSNEKYYIPKHTDDPERFMLCTIDELFAGATIFMLCSSMDCTKMGAAGMFTVILIIKRIKNSFFKDGIDAFMHWHFPGIAPMDAHLPKSANREYIG